MNKHFRDIVLATTGAKEVTSHEVIQTLWSGYGEIVKLGLAGATLESVVLKYIVLPTKAKHPRGWNTDRSHARKIKSYDVEMHWHRDWAHRCNASCRVAECYTAISDEHEDVIVLEDLDAAGFPIRKSRLNREEAKECLSWLANFHACFLGEKPTALWETGTYWHLATRPDEHDAMQEGPLKQAAGAIDERLSSCRYQTLVHGDAKVANFCFSSEKEGVAAVDFQYVGSGCGMKDVAYFLGSCLSDQQCTQWETELLDYYFNTLQRALKDRGKNVVWNALQAEWLAMFPLAWADFHRFLLGWMPTHH